MDDLFLAIRDAANTIAAPSWADIVGVFVSLAALFVAGFVAWRQNIILKRQTEIMSTQTSIADNQNKIALFEKRLEIYDLLASCKVSVETMKMIGNNDDVLEILFALLVRNSTVFQKFNRSVARINLMKCYAVLQRAPFFFSEEIASYIIDVSNKLLVLLTADTGVDGNVNFNIKKQAYFDAIKKLEDNKVLESIKTEMKMI